MLMYRVRENIRANQWSNNFIEKNLSNCKELVCQTIIVLYYFLEYMNCFEVKTKYAKCPLFII